MLREPHASQLLLETLTARARAMIVKDTDIHGSQNCYTDESLKTVRPKKRDGVELGTGKEPSEDLTPGKDRVERPALQR